MIESRRVWVVERWRVETGKWEPTTSMCRYATRAVTEKTALEEQAIREGAPEDKFHVQEYVPRGK